MEATPAMSECLAAGRASEDTLSAILRQNSKPRLLELI